MENNQANMSLIQDSKVSSKFNILQIEAGKIDGVNIPFLLVLPKEMSEQQKLTLVFNNEDGDTLDKSIDKTKERLPDIAISLDVNSPWLIPILPSQDEFNESLKNNGVNLTVGEPKQFAVECFDPSIPDTNKFYRIDQQVRRIIETVYSPDFQEEVQTFTQNDTPLNLEEKMIGFGHSGAGAAIMRFELINYDLFDTSIIGGNADILPTPFGEKGKQLPYPFGTKDFQQLFGKEFDEEAFKNINHQFYIGEKEDLSNIVPTDDPSIDKTHNTRFDTIRKSNYGHGKTGSNFCPENIAIQYKEMYGEALFERFANVLKEYEANCQTVGLRVYEDCKKYPPHSVITRDDFHNIIDNGIYFDTNCSKQIEDILKGRNDKDTSYEISADEFAEVASDVQKGNPIQNMRKASNTLSSALSDKTLENKNDQNLE